MEKRGLGKLFLLTVVTLGIYGIYWEVKTKGEMNAQGAEIPTAWLIIVPIANIWWLWKYAEGVEKVTSNKLSGPVTFLILWLLGLIGMLIVQDVFNRVEGTVSSTAPSTPQPPVATV